MAYILIWMKRPIITWIESQNAYNYQVTQSNFQNIQNSIIGINRTYRWECWECSSLTDRMTSCTCGYIWKENIVGAGVVYNPGVCRWMLRMEAGKQLKTRKENHLPLSVTTHKKLPIGPWEKDINFSFWFPSFALIGNGNVKRAPFNP